MNRHLLSFLIFVFGLWGCVPSLQYRLGQGFYSEKYSKSQVQAAANAGKLENLGRFYEDSVACWNWTQDMTDQNIVFPAIKRKLEQMQGNAADNVVANMPFTGYIVGMFGFPAACIMYTISGEALRVKEGASLYDLFLAGFNEQVGQELGNGHRRRLDLKTLPD